VIEPRTSSRGRARLKLRVAWVLALLAVITISFGLRRIGDGFAGVGREAPPSQSQPATVVDEFDAQSPAPADEPVRIAPTAPLPDPTPAAESGDQRFPAPPSAIMSLLPTFESEDLREEVQNFAAQPRDSAWAAETEARILAHASQREGLALVSLQVECRTSTCLVYAAYPSGARVNPASESKQLARDLRLFPRPKTTVMGLDGSAQAFTFLGRRRSLPGASREGDAAQR